MEKSWLSLYRFILVAEYIYFIVYYIFFLNLLFFYFCWWYVHIKCILRSHPPRQTSPSCTGWRCTKYILPQSGLFYRTRSASFVLYTVNLFLFWKGFFSYKMYSLFKTLPWKNKTCLIWERLYFRSEWNFSLFNVM